MGLVQDLPVFAFIGQVVSTGFKNDFGELVFVCRRLRHNNDALLREHVADGAGFAEVSAVLGEGEANLRNCAIAVVGERVDEDGNTAGTVALEANLLVGCSLELASSLLDGALNVVSRHILGLGCDDGAAEAGIAVRIASAALGRDGDFFDQASKDLATLGVQRALLVLDCRPF